MIGTRFRDTNYSVTADGRVYNATTEREIKQQSNGRYNKVTLSFGGYQKQFLVHRMIAETFIPCDDFTKEVNHKDGNRTNNCVCNLEWVTPSENQKHSVVMGLKKHGKDLWNGKFTKEQVLDIIIRKHKGESCRKLGREFGCDQTTISAISRGLRYKQYFKEGELQHALRLCGLNELADNFII